MWLLLLCCLSSSCFSFGHWCHSCCFCLPSTIMFLSSVRFLVIVVTSVALFRLLLCWLSSSLRVVVAMLLVLLLWLSGCQNSFKMALCCVFRFGWFFLLSAKSRRWPCSPILHLGCLLFTIILHMLASVFMSLSKWWELSMTQKWG